jgi:hypothetical protein
MHPILPCGHIAVVAPLFEEPERKLAFPSGLLFRYQLRMKKSQVSDNKKKRIEPAAGECRAGISPLTPGKN